jgi:hypothetical protein
MHEYYASAFPLAHIIGWFGLGVHRLHGISGPGFRIRGFDMPKLGEMITSSQIVLHHDIIALRQDKKYLKDFLKI